MNEGVDIRLVATWKSSDPQVQAELAIESLRAADHEFFDIRQDTHVPDPPRFGSRDGLIYLRRAGTENPVFRVGYTEDRVTLMVDFPTLKAYRQVRRGFFSWRTLEVNDTEREQRLYERAWKAISDAGLNPYEAKLDWQIA